MQITKTYIMDSVNRTAVPDPTVESIQNRYIEPFFSALFRENRPATMREARDIAVRTKATLETEFHADLDGHLISFGHANALSAYALQRNFLKDGLTQSTAAIISLKMILKGLDVLESFYWRHDLSLTWGGSWFPTCWRVSESSEMSYHECLDLLHETPVDGSPNGAESLELFLTETRGLLERFSVVGSINGNSNGKSPEVRKCFSDMVAFHAAYSDAKIPTSLKNLDITHDSWRYFVGYVCLEKHSLYRTAKFFCSNKRKEHIVADYPSSLSSTEFLDIFQRLVKRIDNILHSHHLDGATCDDAGSLAERLAAICGNEKQ